LLLQGAPKTKGKEPHESQGGDSKDESQGGDSQRIAGAASNSPRGGDPARKTLLERRKKLKAFFAEQDAAEKKQEAQYIDFWFVHMEAYKLKVTLGLDPAAAIQKWRCPMERQKAQESVEEAWFTQVTEVWLSEWRNNSADTLIDLDHDDSVSGLADDIGAGEGDKEELADEFSGGDGVERED